MGFASLYPSYGLRDAGRDTAKTWLDANFEHIGARSTIDFAEMFL